MNDRHIVITGASALCAAGNSFEELGRNLPAFSRVDSKKTFGFHSFDTDIPCYAVAGLDPAAVLGKAGLRTKDWATKLLLCCVESGFGPMLMAIPEPQRPGLCVGTAFGSVQSIGDFLSDSIVNGVNSVNPQAFANTVINAPTSNANIRYVLRNLSTTVSTGFNASFDALLYACDHLRCGYLNAIIAGGIEEISYYGLLGLQRSGALSKSGTMMPLGIDADGTCAGEGCALFLLETKDAAGERGTTVLAEIAGIAGAFDPGPVKQSGNLSRDIVRFVIDDACRQAGIRPSQIGFVAAGANGNPKIDEAEASVLAEVCPGLPVTAYKRKIGECFGASTALSLACALADMRHDRISGIGAGYRAMSGIALVRDTMENRPSTYALVNAFSCDGQCGALIIKKR